MYEMSNKRRREKNTIKWFDLSHKTSAALYSLGVRKKYREEKNTKKNAAR